MPDLHDVKGGIKYGILARQSPIT